jgi:Ca-activated chloride channel family protein
MLATEFHFIRPYWFIAVLPVAIILWKFAKRHLVNKHWESVCDPALLPYILVGHSGAKKYTNIVLASLVSLLMIIALAGPTWERLPQPVFQKESALVIALDLSLSMHADDIKPSRLERARFKISDLLNLRKEGQTALLVYAGSAFVVTPLTDDVKTIKSQLSALSPEIMPTPGSNTGLAIKKAIELLKQGGISRGHVLLVTDEVEKKYEESFLEANDNGYKISILGIGTKEGSPIRMNDGGFLKDRDGTIILAKLNVDTLSQLSHLVGGYYETSQINDNDIERLSRLFNSGLESNEEMETDFKTDQWHEFGPWIVLLILPFVVFGFRRGYLVILVCIMISNPDKAIAFEWDDFWLNKNQQALRALKNEKADVASELFQDDEWKAAAKYRSGDYAASEELLNKFEDDRSIYNKGNSLARQGRYEEAIAAYDQVLKINPEHDDAKFNKKLVEKELEQQQEQEQDQQQEQQSEEQSDSDKDSTEQEQGNQSDYNQQKSGSQGESEQQGDGQSDQGEDLMEKEGEEQSSVTEGTDNISEPQTEEESSEDKEQQSLEPRTNELDEDQQVSEQWLRRIPDDPSGLLRRKFQYQYQQQQRKPTTNEKYW